MNPVFFPWLERGDCKKFHEYRSPFTTVELEVIYRVTPISIPSVPFWYFWWLLNVAKKFAVGYSCAGWLIPRRSSVMYKVFGVQDFWITVQKCLVLVYLNYKRGSTESRWLSKCQSSFTPWQYKHCVAHFFSPLILTHHPAVIHRYIQTTHPSSSDVMFEQLFWNSAWADVYIVNTVLVDSFIIYNSSVSTFLRIKISLALIHTYNHVQRLTEPNQ